MATITLSFQSATTNSISVQAVYSGGPPSVKRCTFFIDSDIGNLNTPIDFSLTANKTVNHTYTQGLSADNLYKCYIRFYDVNDNQTGNTIIEYFYTSAQPVSMSLTLNSASVTSLNVTAKYENGPPSVKRFTFFIDSDNGSLSTPYNFSLTANKTIEHTYSQGLTANKEYKCYVRFYDVNDSEIGNVIETFKTLSGQTFCKDGPLTLEEKTGNAEYILTYLLGIGWTKNAVCGMLGNMEHESSINPCRWQSDINYDHMPYDYVPSQGFGLVQWTPFNKYTIWARDNGLPYKNMDSQLLRILYEVDNKIQYYATSSYPLSFTEFTQSTKSPEYLAQAFLKNYERPANQDQPDRSTRARYWFDNLTGEAFIDPEPPKNNYVDIHALWLAGTLKGGI